jgi:hypothetical protein
MEDVGIFYGHLVYFAVIWFILGLFGIFYSYLIYFSLFWYIVPRKIWLPWSVPVKDGYVVKLGFILILCS